MNTEFEIEHIQGLLEQLDDAGRGAENDKLTLLVLKWLNDVGLVRIEITPPGDENKPRHAPDPYDAEIKLRNG